MKTSDKKKVSLFLYSEGTPKPERPQEERMRCLYHNIHYICNRNNTYICHNDCSVCGRYFFDLAGNFHNSPAAFVFIRDKIFDANFRLFVDMISNIRQAFNGNLRHDPKQHRSKQNPFIGMLYCGTCGGAMGLVHTKKGNKRYHYYICTEDTKRNFSTCPVKRIPADALQKAVLDQVGELLQSTTLIAQMAKEDNSMTAPKFRTVLKNIHGIWSVMCHYERCRLLQNIISRILIFDDRLEIEPKIDGIKALLKDVGVEVK